MKNSYLRVVLLSCLIWLIPLIASFFFYNQEGDLQVNFWFFKVAMIIVSSVTVLITLSKYLKASTTVSWVTFSIIALVVNCILDFIVLIGLLGFGIGNWVVEILPVYIVFIPLTTLFSYSLFGAQDTK